MSFGVLAARQGRGADAGSVVTAGGQSGLGGLLRIHARLLKVPTSDLVDLRVAIEAMIAHDHAAIAHHVAEGDADGAAAAVTEHVRGFYELLRPEGGTQTHG